MRNKLSLLVLVGLLSTMPLLAGHKHRRGCGHHYHPQRGWVSVQVFGRHGGFAYQSAPDPYYYGPRQPRYYRDGYFDGRHARRYCERSCRHRHRHVHHQPRYRGYDRCPHPFRGW